MTSVMCLPAPDADALSKDHGSKLPETRLMAFDWLATNWINMSTTDRIIAVGFAPLIAYSFLIHPSVGHQTIWVIDRIVTFLLGRR